MHFTTLLCAHFKLLELITPNAAVGWLTHLPRIRELSASNLGPESGSPEFHRDFSQSLQANAEILP
jgi:hypothetical protein